MCSSDLHFGNDFENFHIQGNSNQFPSIIGEWRLSNYVHTDSLKSQMLGETWHIPNNALKIQFTEIPSNEQMNETDEIIYSWHRILQRNMADFIYGDFLEPDEKIVNNN